MYQEVYEINFSKFDCYDDKKISVISTSVSMAIVKAKKLLPIVLKEDGFGANEMKGWYIKKAEFVLNVY